MLKRSKRNLNIFSILFRLLVFPELFLSKFHEHSKKQYKKIVLSLREEQAFFATPSLSPSNGHYSSFHLYRSSRSKSINFLRLERTGRFYLSHLGLEQERFWKLRPPCPLHHCPLLEMDSSLEQGGERGGSSGRRLQVSLCHRGCAPTRVGLGAGRSGRKTPRVVRRVERPAAGLGV